MDVIERIAEKLGSQAAIARLCDVSPQAVFKWKTIGVPAEHCRTLQAATGITAEEIRPDIFELKPAIPPAAAEAQAAG